MDAIDQKIKAYNLGAIAKRHGWKGQIIHDPKLMETTFSARRGVERIYLQWSRGRLAEKPEYKLLQRTYYLPSQHSVMEKLCGWPDIIKILELNRKSNNKYNAVKLVKYYSKLPFDPIEDDDETIISALVNHKIWWYNSISGKIQKARVMLPKKKSQVFNVKQVGHRRMFSFTEPDIGMRSVMIDQILKVE